MVCAMSRKLNLHGFVVGWLRSLKNVAQPYLAHYIINVRIAENREISLPCMWFLSRLSACRNFIAETEIVLNFSMNKIVCLIVE